MNVEVFDIKIIDTHENDRVLQLESTEFGAPKLQYNGFKHKAGDLMPSELHFNLLTADAADAKYLHLFTGSETRYKVILEDATDEQNPVEIWRGFLLPEQFAEPYDNGCFFVELIATDGIGRLKEKQWIGSGKVSVISVIQRCLHGTGLQLPILFAPAVQNSAFELDYQQLEADAASYIDEGEGESLYDVLQKMMVSIGCKLFLFQEAWYIVGLNRFKEQEIDFYKYAYDLGVFNSYFEGKVTVTRNRLVRSFFTKPIIEMMPLLNKMKVAWDWNVNKNLLPEKVIGAIPDTIDYTNPNVEMVYWLLSKSDERVQGNTLLAIKDLSYDYSKIPFDQYYNGFVVRNGDPKIVDGGSIVIRSGEVPNVAVSGGELSFIQLSDLAENFISLKEPVFIEGSQDIARTSTLIVEGFVFLMGNESDGSLEASRNQIDEDIENDVLKNHVIVEMFYKEHPTQGLSEEVLHLSTRLDNDLPADFFSIKFTRERNTLKFKLEVKDLMFVKSGYYNFRVYPLVRHLHLKAEVVLTALSFNMNLPSSLDYKIDRQLDFTTSEEIEVFHSTTRMNITDRRLTFSEELQSQLVSGSSVNNYLPVVKKYYRENPVYNGGLLWYTNVFVGVSDDVYRMLQGGFSLYKQLPNTTSKVLVSPDDYLIGKGESGLEIRQLKFAADPSMTLIEEDASLFIALNTQEGSFYLDNWLDRWQLVNGYSADNKKFHEVIADMYIALRKRSSYLITGVISGLVSPLDFLIFNFIDRKDYYITNLTLDLVQGESEVTMFEVLPAEDTIVIEGEDEVIDIPEDGGDPEITITAKSEFIDPMFSASYWQVSVDYDIKNITPVNATLKFIKYTDTIANGGVPTGLVKEVAITQASGNHKQTFYPLPDNEKGWYEVVLVQDAVESNKEYVKVSELITHNVITLALVSLTGKTAVFSVAHSLGFPASLEKLWQEYGGGTPLIPLGLYPIGLEQSEVISPTVTQFSHTFSKDGIFKVRVLGDGIYSNEVSVNTDAWFNY